MIEKDLFIKNSILSTSFDLYLLEHPEVLDQLPDSAIIALMPEDDPELAEFNLKLAEEKQQPGQPIVRVKFPKLGPPTSRISQFEIETIKAD